MPPQDADAERVERGDLRPFFLLAEQAADPLLHLRRGLVGERDGQNALRPRACAIRFAMRNVTTRVLPVPAPARTSSGPVERVAPLPAALGLRPAMGRNRSARISRSE